MQKNNPAKNSKKQNKGEPVPQKNTLSTPGGESSDSPGLSHAVRGILVGSALGVFAVLLGIWDSMPRALVLGGIGGLLAGVTLAKLRSRK